MASIQKRGKTYSVVYYKKDEAGAVKQVWESGYSYNHARTRKAKIELEIAQEQEEELKRAHERVENSEVEEDEKKFEPKSMTVSAFLREYIDKYGSKKWVGSTYEGNLGLMENYVHPYIGDKDLVSIKTKTVDDYYDFLLKEATPSANMGKPRREHLSPATIHQLHKVLRCAFNVAVRWDYIEKNPFLNATLPDHQEKERIALEPEQVLKILDYTCRPDNYDYFLIHCAVLIAIGCTLRGGEICGLQWDRVDFEKQLFNVDRVIDRVSKDAMSKLSKMEILYQFPNLYPGTRTTIVLKRPKTKGSIRLAEIPTSILQALSTLEEMQEQLKTDLGPTGYIDYNLVICQANGRPLMTEHLNKRFKDILCEINDPDINPEEIVFHSLRHTSASTKLILSNGDYNSVKHAGGWANLEMLTRRYGAHSFVSDRERLAQKMDDFLTAKSPQTETFSQAESVTGSISPEDALKILSQINPDLLIQFAKSIQSANKE